MRYDEEFVSLVADQVAKHLDHDRWLSSKEAAAYLGISVNALHKHTAARDIPFEQDVPGGKLWFKRLELDAWRRR